MSAALVPSVFLIVLGASVVRGFGGFGFALISVPLLASIIQPRDAVILSVGLQILVGLYDVRSSFKMIRWPLLRPLLAGAALATPVGYLGLLLMPPQLAREVIAAAAVLALVLLFVRKAQHLESALAPLIVGVTAGLMNGLAAMPGPPILAYFLESDIPSESARASMIVFFLASSLLAAASAAVMGGWSTHILALMVASIPALILGNWTGKMLFLRASPLVFRRLMLVALVIATTTAIWKSIA